MRHAAAATFVVLFAGGCSSPDVPAVDASEGGQGSCMLCRDGEVNLPPVAKVRAVLSVNCANTDGCHGAGAGNLPMPSGNEFGSMLDVRSFEMPSLLRVKPGDPAMSYLYRKLACDAGPIAQSCMPPGSPLSPSLVQAFHDWIEAGAPTQ